MPNLAINMIKWRVGMGWRLHHYNDEGDFAGSPSTPTDGRTMLLAATAGAIVGAVATVLCLQRWGTPRL